MIHQASWKALFNLLNTVNKSGNQNISRYTGAMDFKANSDVKMMGLNQAYSFLLAKNYTKEITSSIIPTTLAEISSAPQIRWDALSE